MMPKHFLVLALTAGIALTACSGNEKHEMAEPGDFDAEAAMALLVTDIDAACGMEITTDVLQDTSSYQGKIYGFCSASCKTTFLEDPETFIAALPIEAFHGEHDEEGHEHHD